MKFLAFTLLAVCLIQGHNAQFSGLRSLVSGAAGAVNNVVNTAEKAVSSTFNAAQNVASTAANAAQSAVSGISSAAQSVLSAAPSLSADELTSKLSGLTDNQLLDTVKGAAEEVKTRAEAATGAITDAVSNVEKKAEDAVASATAGWNVDVKAVLEKAKKVGVDVKECAVDKVLELSTSAATTGVKCVTDKVTEAVTLAKNIANLVPRSATLAKDGVQGYMTCSKQSNKLLKTTCQATKLVPVAVKSTLLVKDSVSYAAQTAKMVTGLKSHVTTCVSSVTKKATEAAAQSLKIVSCVNGKIQAAKSA